MHHIVSRRGPFGGSLSLFCRGSCYRQITERVYYYANYSRIELITTIDTAICDNGNNNDKCGTPLSAARSFGAGDNGGARL